MLRVALNSIQFFASQSLCDLLVRDIVERLAIIYTLVKMI
jgi:hypothetical protein